MKNMIVTTLLLIAFKLTAMAQPDQTITNTFPFELSKYLGRWYEVARFDHSFERGLEGTTATYTLLNDGTIEVVNEGYKNGVNGKKQKAVGKAKLTSAATPRNLKVSFFWIFYSPYNILELDENYQYALIGSSSEKYLWILSRKPNMDNETYNMLLNKAKARGYDISKLIKVAHPK